jgi:tetratricopeptide (TPR) repeat protein
MFFREYEKSHRDYDTAISLSDDNCSFYHAKGLAFQYSEDYSSAKDCFKKALQIDPSHLPSIFHLGLMHHKLGELADALESFSQVIRINSKKEERIVSAYINC